MEIKDMMMDQVEARLAEIRSEIDSADAARILELDSEVDELNARKAEILNEAEKRSALLDKVASADSLNLFNFVPFDTLLIPMIITFCAAGMFVGIVGSWTSIRKFMDV